MRALRRRFGRPWAPLVLDSPPAAAPEPLPAAVLVAAEPDEFSGFSYVCRRCDVTGRTPARTRRLCWSCQRSDQLEGR